MSIIQNMKKRRFRKQYRMMHACNATWPENIFDLSQVIIGNKTWGGIRIINYDALHRTKLQIGSYCSIASGVEFLLGGNHRSDRISTFLFKQSGYIPEIKTNGENIKDKGDIIVEDDVWIGYKSIILSGAHISQGAIVGAGSVVAGYIPPYCVYVGNKCIKKRFSEQIVEKIIKLNYEKVDKLINEKSEVLEEIFYSDVDDVLVDRILKVLD